MVHPVPQQKQNNKKLLFNVLQVERDRDKLNVKRNGLNVTRRYYCAIEIYFRSIR